MNNENDREALINEIVKRLKVISVEKVRLILITVLHIGT